MARGLAINIGINSVDPGHYGGWTGALKACEADARDMHALAEENGFEAGMLLTREATAEAVTAAIRGAAQSLEAGDILFLTYSGHGGQVGDLHAEEDDARDETWVLYDRQLVDDELFSLWGEFQPGVRIFMLSDSCHSGTVARDVFDDLILPNSAAAFLERAGGGKPETKSMPIALRMPVYEAHRELYDGIERSLPAGDDVDVKAHVLLISGCQDNQESLDGERNGLFTATLLDVWDGGSYKHNHRRLRQDILKQMPPYQSPNLFLAGPRNREFERQRPLVV